MRVDCGLLLTSYRTDSDRFALPLHSGETKYSDAVDITSGNGSSCEASGDSEGSASAGGSSDEGSCPALLHFTAIAAHD